MPQESRSERSWGNMQRTEAEEKLKGRKHTYLPSKPTKKSVCFLAYSGLIFCIHLLRARWHAIISAKELAINLRYNNS